MARTMVFIDHMNFQIALSSLYNPESPPRLDYNELPRQIVAAANTGELMKTILFIPKPDDFLMKDEGLEKYYLWAAGMKVQRNFDVVEGSHMARPTRPDVPMNIRDSDTYYKVEKGTDVNIAIYALRMAFFNAYDTAVFVSGDVRAPLFPDRFDGQRPRVNQAAALPKVRRRARIGIDFKRRADGDARLALIDGVFTFPAQTPPRALIPRDFIEGRAAGLAPHSRGSDMPVHAQAVLHGAQHVGGGLGGINVVAVPACGHDAHKRPHAPQLGKPRLDDGREVVIDILFLPIKISRAFLQLACRAYLAVLFALKKIQIEPPLQFKRGALSLPFFKLPPYPVRKLVVPPFLVGVFCFHSVSSFSPLISRINFFLSSINSMSVMSSIPLPS